MTTTLIIPITLPFQSPFLPIPPLKTTPQPEGEQVKDKGKKALSHEEVVKEESKSDFDAEIKLLGSMVEIKNQKEIEQLVKVDVAKEEIKKGKEELVDLLGLDVVRRMYKAKVKYDKYCIKMLNMRAQGKITNCVVLSGGKGPITLKIYRDDGFNEIIQNFKIEQRLDNLHKTKEELELDFSKPLGASNSELVEPLPEPERTLNCRLRRLNKSVPFERRDERPKQPRVVYVLILGINYFRHFLDILENYNPIDDEPMWLQTVLSL
ncbi:hypothetical protein Tco_0001247 [Tanacetum coccineum]